VSVTAIVLQPGDTVACLLRDHRAGEPAILPTGPTPPLCIDTPMGHKIALVAMAQGAMVVKYGAPIGRATADIAPGDHVHLHNLTGALR